MTFTLLFFITVFYNNLTLGLGGKKMTTDKIDNLTAYEVKSSDSRVVDKDHIRNENLSDIFRNQMLFFVGFPGSGKGTQGKRLADKLNIRHLSTGELFRAEVKKGSEVGRKMDDYMQQGKVIPKELTFDYLRTELSNPEYRKGFILDGYPKDLECYKFIVKTLSELQFKPSAAIHFEISREQVAERLRGRLHCKLCEHDFHVKFLPPMKKGVCDNCEGPLLGRRDDSEEAIQKRLSVFEKNTSPVVKKFKETGILIEVDATQSPDQVNEEIISIISEIGRKQIHEGGTYYLRPLKDCENSSVFHNHIDAESHPVLRSIVNKIEKVSLDWQNKLYPVSDLHLGPQVKDPEFASVYKSLPNFHPIRNATDEAFSTGKMGEIGFNYDQVRETLKVAFQYSNQGVMTELEEDIYEKEFDEKGNATIVLNRGNTPYSIDWSKLEGWRKKQIENVPRFELHHGFDIAKKSDEANPPIDVSELSKKTTESGFQTGGWFIFRKQERWSYRSNEFSNKEYKFCLNKLNNQAVRLRAIVKEILSNRQFTSSSSMEKVHAMWRV